MALQQFPHGRVELVAIAVEGNVAARDHDAAARAAPGVMRQRRRGNPPKLDRPQTGVANGALHAPADPGRTGAQVQRHIELLARYDAPGVRRNRLQILHFRQHVDIDLERREVRDLSPPSAGSEL